MAAAGLTEQPEDTIVYVKAIADYALAIKKSLQEVNEHSWNNFKLRIG